MKSMWLGAVAMSLALGLAGGAAAAEAGDERPAAGAVTPNAPYTPTAKRIDPNVGLMMSRNQPVGETPRRPNGKPDMTGAWGANWPPPFGVYGRRELDTSEPDQATLQRANQWNKPIYRPEFWEKVHSLDWSTIEVDPVYNCGRRGTPRLGPPNRIMQNEKEIWLMYGGETTRVIQIGAKHDEEDPDFDTYYGKSVANWDGDTLVIDSVGFNDLTWLRWQGYFHTNRMSVKETLRREGNLLFWQNTVTDPQVLQEPWTSDVSVRRINPTADSPEENPPCDERDAEGIFDKYYRG
jgi:hypothetical protein